MAAPRSGQGFQRADRSGAAGGAPGDRRMGRGCIRADPDAPLFLGARGNGLDAAVAQRTLRLYRRQNGLPEHATPHALRHSSPPICWRAGLICVRSRTCLGTRVCRRRSAIPASTRRGCWKSGGRRTRGRNQILCVRSTFAFRGTARRAHGSCREFSDSRSSRLGIHTFRILQRTIIRQVVLLSNYETRSAALANHSNI